LKKEKSSIANRMLRPASHIPVLQLSNHQKLRTENIIFYDGNCPMCNAWVKRIIPLDHKKRFHFAPLESETAHKVLTPIMPEYLKEDTIIYYEDGQVYLRSSAAIRIMAALGLPYNLGVVFALVPLRIRDGVYRWVANRRYKYGKRYDSCPVPPIEWRDRFLS
jgi:predicted DCC family thiol-disulfide oxidoreductase YuxK